MSYDRVLLALDVMADSAGSVVQRALQVAPGAEFIAAHVVERRPFGVEMASFRELADLQDLVMKGAAERLEALCAPARTENRVVLKGHAAHEIGRYAAEVGADLVVMGAHGRYGWRVLPGSTANAVLHSRVCDVLCVHIPAEVRQFDEILVAVDATEEVRSVLGRAVEVAAVSGARVSVVSVLRPLEHAFAGMDLSAYADTARSMAREADEQARTRIEDLAKVFELTGECFVQHGYPAEEIHALTDELSADLVVVGTHERHGLGRLVGSTANAVLHGAKSDVLAVRV